jgi:choline-glycine betaine transporter
MNNATIIALKYNPFVVDLGIGVFCIAYGVLFLMGASKHRETDSPRAKRLFWCGLLCCIGGGLFVIKSIATL